MFRTQHWAKPLSHLWESDTKKNILPVFKNLLYMKLIFFLIVKDAASNFKHPIWST